ncbi:unnamed protein product [Amoebophrya sp. A120]|nr:unnamed protein product [Amoebophrya sp. A120]|eukprot:GSA120T00003512001.1
MSPGGGARLATYARICPVFDPEDATCQIEVQSTAENEHWLSLEIPHQQGYNGNSTTGSSSHNSAYNHDAEQLHSTGHQLQPQQPVLPCSSYRGLFNGQVFTPHSEQEEIFAEFEPFVDNLVRGITGCVFAYGQTGTGKTYTIYGGSKYRERGLIPRFLCGVFQKLREKDAELRRSGLGESCSTGTEEDHEGSYYRYQVSVKCLEVYNDQGYDLLLQPQANSGTAPSLKVDLFQTQPNLAEHVCQSEREALDCVFLAALNRSDARTKTNSNSSRSHAIFTIFVEQWEGDTHLAARLHLVDLAGSERVYKTCSLGQQQASSAPGGLLPGEPQGKNKQAVNHVGRLTEAKSINKSLHFLEQVVIAMQNESGFVPFRNSLMTFLLKEALVGNCKTALVATMSALLQNAQESLSTLRFAQRCSSVVLQTEVRPNLAVDYRLRALKLEDENRRLAERVRMLELMSVQERADQAGSENKNRTLAAASTVRNYMPGRAASVEQVQQQWNLDDQGKNQNQTEELETNNGRKQDAHNYSGEDEKSSQVLLKQADVFASPAAFSSAGAGSTTSSTSARPAAAAPALPQLGSRSSTHNNPGAIIQLQPLQEHAAAGAASTSSRPLTPSSSRPLTPSARQLGNNWMSPLPLSLRHLGFSETGQPTDVLLDEQFPTVTSLIAKMMTVMTSVAGTNAADNSSSAGRSVERTKSVGVTATVVTTEQAADLRDRQPRKSSPIRANMNKTKEHEYNFSPNRRKEPTSDLDDGDTTPHQYRRDRTSSADCTRSRSGSRSTRRYVRVSPGRAAAAWIENVVLGATTSRTGCTTSEPAPALEADPSRSGAVLLQSRDDHLRDDFKILKEQKTTSNSQTDEPEVLISSRAVRRSVRSLNSPVREQEDSRDVTGPRDEDLDLRDVNKDNDAGAPAPALLLSSSAKKKSTTTGAKHQQGIDLIRIDLTNNNDERGNESRPTTRGTKSRGASSCNSGSSTTRTRTLSQKPTGPTASTSPEKLPVEASETKFSLQEERQLLDRLQKQYYSRVQQSAAA